MSDLISRQAAIEAIFKVGHEHIMENVLPIGAVLDYSEAIKALPTVDAVEVVRCKDCKHLEEWSDTDGTRTLSCDTTYDNFGYHADVTPYHYCGYAERSE